MRGARDQSWSFTPGSPARAALLTPHHCSTQTLAQSHQTVTQQYLFIYLDALSSLARYLQRHSDPCTSAYRVSAPCPAVRAVAGGRQDLHQALAAAGWWWRVAPGAGISRLAVTGHRRNSSPAQPSPAQSAQPSHLSRWRHLCWLCCPPLLPSLPVHCSLG